MAAHVTSTQLLEQSQLAPNRPARNGQPWQEVRQPSPSPDAKRLRCEQPILEALGEQARLLQTSIQSTNLLIQHLLQAAQTRTAHTMAKHPTKHERGNHKTQPLSHHKSSQQSNNYISTS